MRRSIEATRERRYGPTPRSGGSDESLEGLGKVKLGYEVLRIAPKSDQTSMGQKDLRIDRFRGDSMDGFRERLRGVRLRGEFHGAVLNDFACHLFKPVGGSQLDTWPPRAESS